MSDRTETDLKPRYSGKKSKKFWARIDQLNGERHAAAYALGCILQDCEARVLREIAALIERERTNG